MLYGICNLSIVPLRIEASDTSEMVSQVLFGEHFKVLEKRKKWSKIRLHLIIMKVVLITNNLKKLLKNTIFP